MSKKCTSTKLVDDDLCAVKYWADRNKVNLYLGNMTLHLTGEQFEGLSRAFSAALKEKRGIDQASAAAEPLDCAVTGRFH